MHQLIPFDTSDIFDKSLKKYEPFFPTLDLICMEESPHMGRKPISWAFLLRVLIFKNLKDPLLI